MHLTCPGCHAGYDLELVDFPAKVRCPQCGTKWMTLAGGQVEVLEWGQVPESEPAGETGPAPVEAAGPVAPSSLPVNPRPARHSAGPARVATVRQHRGAWKVLGGLAAGVALVVVALALNPPWREALWAKMQGKPAVSADTGNLAVAEPGEGLAPVPKAAGAGAGANPVGRAVEAQAAQEESVARADSASAEAVVTRKESAESAESAESGDEEGKKPEVAEDEDDAGAVPRLGEAAAVVVEAKVELASAAPEVAAALKEIDARIAAQPETAETEVRNFLAGFYHSSGQGTRASALTAQHPELVVEVIGSLWMRLKMYARNALPETPELKVFNASRGASFDLGESVTGLLEQGAPQTGASLAVLAKSQVLGGLLTHFAEGQDPNTVDNALFLGRVLNETSRINQFRVDLAPLAGSTGGEQVAAARAILESWRATDGGDERQESPLILALFTGSDTEPAPEYQARLSRTMLHIQEFYAREMARLGFGSLTFPLEMEDNDLVRIHLVRGQHPNEHYQKPSGDEIFKEVKAQLLKEGIDPENRVVVMFCNLTVWDPVKRTISHHSPYYAGGGHRGGRAWQLDSLLLDAGELTNTDPDLKVTDGEYGVRTIGQYNTHFVGGVAHELGHALGLPHNKQFAGESQVLGDAIMGMGNHAYGRELRGEGKGAFLTLPHAMRLATNCAFSGSVKEADRRPESRFTRLDLAPIPGGVRVTGEIETDLPVYAVVAYADPEGNDDYNAHSYVAVPDPDGRFELEIPEMEGPVGELRLLRIHVNGNASRDKEDTTSYRVDANGEVEVEPFPASTESTSSASLAPGDRDGVPPVELLGISPPPQRAETLADWLDCAHCRKAAGLDEGGEGETE